MLIDIQAHYLDLIVKAAEESSGACLMRRQGEGGGTIYVTRSATTTKGDYAVQFAFDDEGVRLGVSFRDSRPKVAFKSSYGDGIDGFFPLFMKALNANRLEDRRAA
jgi:hypothetical protein